MCSVTPQYQINDLNEATHTHVETMENNDTFYFLIFQAPLAVVSQILA